MNDKKLPFYFLVDDCAFPRIHGRHGEAIPFSVYEQLCRLAEKFAIKIPLCLTMSYLDVGRRAPGSEPVSYAEKLIDFIKRNAHAFEIVDHGLYHRMNDDCTVFEFFNPLTGEFLSEEEHRSRLSISHQIYQDVGFDFPEVFVPPAHGWKPGITDKVYAESGCLSLISYSRIKHPLTGRPSQWKHMFKPRFVWPSSSYLEVLPRIGMGLDHDDCALTYVKQHFIRRWIQPTDSLSNAFFHRSRQLIPVHSYMTHVANFMGSNALSFWTNLLKWVKGRRRLVLASSIPHARQLYHSYLDDFVEERSK